MSFCALPRLCLRQLWLSLSNNRQKPKTSRIHRLSVRYTRVIPLFRDDNTGCTTLDPLNSANDGRFLLFIFVRKDSALLSCRWLAYYDAEVLIFGVHRCK